MRQKLLIILLFFFASFSVANSQELDDIHTTVRQITDFFNTQYGTLVYYSSTKIDSEAIYIPTSWFFPLNTRTKQEEESDGPRPIVARLNNLVFNLNSPFIEFEYINKELHHINLYLTKDQLRTDNYFLPRDLRDLDLESKFKEQENYKIVVVK